MNESNYIFFAFPSKGDLYCTCKFNSGFGSLTSPVGPLCAACKHCCGVTARVQENDPECSGYVKCTLNSKNPIDKLKSAVYHIKPMNKRIKYIYYNTDERAGND